MDSSSSFKSWVNCGCCNCSCFSWNRDVKRKLNQVSNDIDYESPFSPSVARVEIENECIALRELVIRQQQAIQDLYTEIEEERNASASATTEAMSMILRLQREKAEAQMEARQYKRFAEEKMTHDQKELLAFDDLLHKRDHAIQSLNYHVQAYKHRLMSFGCSPDEAEVIVLNTSMGVSMEGNAHNEGVEGEVQIDDKNHQLCDYPPLKCSRNEALNNSNPAESSLINVDKCAFEKTYHNEEHVQDLDGQIIQIEHTPWHDEDVGRNPSSRMEGGQSPRGPWHPNMFSTDSFGASASLAMDNKMTGKDSHIMEIPNKLQLGSVKDFSNTDDDQSSRKVDTLDPGDDTSDKICTIDSIKDVKSNSPIQAKASIRLSKDYVNTPRESLARVGTEEKDIKKLQVRLQTLEAERDSMKQEFMSMKTDQAKLIFMKAIAQHLSQENSSGDILSMEKPSLAKSSSSTSVLERVTSIFHWRKKAKPAKYPCGQSESNVGLLCLLKQKPNIRQLRFVTRVSST